MDRKPAVKIKYLFLLFSGLFFSDCANQLPPGGGKVDLIPPEIIEAYPENETISFDENYFELGFSEYVDKRTMRDAIFISPAVEGNLELDWSGRYVRVYFPEELRENTTYVVTIGTDVVDFNNQNRMADAFTLTFSTGNKIDRKMISGNIYDEKPGGILLFAYKLISDSDPVGINPMEDKPDFISQTGSSGEFKLAGLGEGTYRVFAIQDEFRDLIFQPDQDRYGAPFKDITLGEADTLFAGLNFFLTNVDTIKPRLLSASMTDRYHILVNLSEEFDSTIISSKNFFIYDSTAGTNEDILYAFKGNTKPTEMVLVIDADLFQDNDLYLFADSIKDKEGNIFSNDFSSITVSEVPDTTKPELFKAIPSAGSNAADFQNQKFSFFFNDAFDTSIAKQGISFTDTLRKAVPYDISFMDDASFEIQPRQNLEKQKDYIIKLDLTKFQDAAGNYNDSVYQYTFKTISGLNFTGVSGFIQNVDQTKNPIIVLQGVDADKTRYAHKPLSSGKFQFDRVKPGKYLLSAFLDEDSSSTYDYGYPFPFEPSEEFSFYPDTLQLRPRWTQTDLYFNF